MTKKTKQLTIFFTLLTVAFVTLLTFLNGGEMMKRKYRTVSEVKPFKFIDQDSGIVTNDKIEGKVALVEYFFTTCTTICPPMNTTMRSIYDIYKNDTNFIILSHTSDPKNDNPSRLKKYADSIGAGKNWLFLTGEKKDLYYHARSSYSVDDANRQIADPETDFVHTQLFALVNKKGLVKKRVYDSSIPEEVEDLKKDIKLALSGNL